MPDDGVQHRADLRLANVCEYLIIIASERLPGLDGPPVIGTFALPSYVTNVRPEELPRTVFVQPDEFEAIRTALTKKAQARGGEAREFSSAWHGRLALMGYLDLGDRIHVRVNELMPAPPSFR